MFIRKRLQMTPTNESGFASLVVGLVLIVVLGLMTVGFARLSRHEQVQALNSQLATEASYAAESGINDAVQDVDANLITAGTAEVDSGKCLSLPLPGMSSNSNFINTTDDVSYTCVLVNLKTDALQYGDVNYGDSRTTVTTAENPTTDAPLSSLTVSWGSDDNHTAYPGLATKFPTFTSWNNNNYLPLIQFSITPLSSPTTRAALINDAFTVFLYPSNSGPNTVNYSFASQAGTADGTVVAGNCNNGAAPYNCKVTINGITGSGLYLVRVQDFYDASNIRITGTDSSGNAVDFNGGQAQIDVTGKAQDVLKRLDVSVPINNDVYPAYALEAQNICKRIETGPASIQNPNPTSFIDPTSGGVVTTNPCGLENNN